MKDMMKNCMEHCRWCPLIPLSLGIIAFVLGYYLDAELVRIIWLVLASLGMLMGLMALIMMNVMRSKMK